MIDVNYSLLRQLFFPFFPVHIFKVFHVDEDEAQYEFGDKTTFAQECDFMKDYEHVLNESTSAQEREHTIERDREMEMER